MILEALEYLVTPCPRWARNCGYAFETMAYHARYRRNREAWQPHLDRTRQVIRDAIAACPSTRTAVVAGSGYGYDLPLRELAVAFDKVYLLDAVHPWSIRWATATNFPLRQVHLDLTEIAALANTYRWPVRVAVPGFFLSQPNVDLVVSANVISQLAVMPLRKLGKRVLLDPGRSAELEADLIARHIDWLNSFDAVRVLIGDQSQTKETPDEIQVVDILDNHRLGEPVGGWDWDIAPQGRFGNRPAQNNRVAAWMAASGHSL